MMFSALAAILYIISIAMIGIGGYVAADGMQMFPAERGVAQYIAGFSLVTGGCVLLGIATLILCLGSLNRTLRKARAAAPATDIGAPDEVPSLVAPASAVATAAAAAVAVAVAPAVKDIAAEPYGTGLSPAEPDGAVPPAKTGEAPMFVPKEAAPAFAKQEKAPQVEVRDSAFGYSYAPSPALHPLPPSPVLSPPPPSRPTAMADSMPNVAVNDIIGSEIGLKEADAKVPKIETTVVEGMLPAAGQPKSAPTVIGSYESGGNRYVMYSNGFIEAHLPGGPRIFQSLDKLKQFIASGNV